MSGARETSFPKERIKVLLLENVAPTAAETFAAERFQVESLPAALSEDELAARIPDVHVLGIRSRTRLGEPALAGARRLLAVGTFCIGTDQVALDPANRLGVPVFNAPFSSTRSVAELVIGEVITLSRQVADRTSEVHGGRWRKVAHGCHEVRGKTLGIVGYGHIGIQVGILAEAMGLHVIFHDIVRKLPMGNAQVYPSLGDLLRHADYVTLHVPDTPQTRGMIDGDAIRAMKKGAYLINASRGRVVVIPELAAAVRSGHLGGAAIDVYPEEPESNADDFTSELRGLPNVILTPHIGGSTEEAQAAIGREVAASLIRFINEGATTGAVNFPQAELPGLADTHRILNVHRNVPGVLREISRIVSDQGVNIRAEVLSTDRNIGYLIMDLDRNVAEDVKRAVAALPTSIKTRILY